MIRIATLLDVPEIVKLTEQFYPETPYWTEHKIPFDYETVRDLVGNVVKRGIFVVAQQDDRLVGIMGAHVVPFVFNLSYTVCVEAIWWVVPEFRKTGLGVEMIHRVDKLRKLRNCKTFQMMRVAGTNPALDDLLIGLGFKPSEYCLTKVD